MKTQFIVDEAGHKTAVILPIDDYNALVSELEDADDVRMYDEAKKEDDGARMLFTDYLKSRKAKNA
ncbi:hypothetical protein KXQ82_18655 [Mucilaginibacter sp. HMF5004]|uniref:hypothetical protein n=1 Tax=Mucilaginibacter rivuli TaxID=2857527 RepID=UPI001C5D118A|nr:hypothetical protein [Mucilaginibacter rivuli]MBW4891753.1 hypothetical protein [Mucilaginibacter rivuli]